MHNQRLGMMTLMGQNGEKQDPPKGIQMLRIAAERADENAPQGAYVSCCRNSFSSQPVSLICTVGSRYALRARATPSYFSRNPSPIRPASSTDEYGKGCIPGICQSTSQDGCSV